MVCFRGKFKYRIVWVVVLILLIRFLWYKKWIPVHKDKGGSDSLDVDVTIEPEQHVDNIVNKKNVINKENIYNKTSLPHVDSKQTKTKRNSKEIEILKEDSILTPHNVSASWNTAPLLHEFHHGLPNLRKKYQIPHLSHPVVKRGLHPDEYNGLMRLLYLVDAIFTRNNISYSMIHGTLLGSYMFHDLIPWDDDIDMIVDNTSKPLVYKLLDGLKVTHGVHTLQRDENILKIFFNTSIQSGMKQQYAWRFPFIDVTFFVNKNGNFYAIDRYQHLGIPWSHVFPLHRRPFGPLWLLAPRNSRHALRAKFARDFICSTTSWDHRAEEYFKQIVVNCTDVLQYYPYVTRSGGKYSTEEEALILNGKTYYTVNVREEGRYGDNTVQKPYSYDMR